MCPVKCLPRPSRDGTLETWRRWTVCRTQTRRGVLDMRDGGERRAERRRGWEEEDGRKRRRGIQGVRKQDGRKDGRERER